MPSAWSLSCKCGRERTFQVAIARRPRRNVLDVRDLAFVELRAPQVMEIAFKVHKRAGVGYAFSFGSRSATRTTDWGAACGVTVSFSV